VAQQAAFSARVEQQLSFGKRPFAVLEFGNVAAPVGSGDDARHAVTCFARCVAVGGPGAPMATRAQLIRSVSFNINPRYPKSAVRTTRDKGLGGGSKCAWLMEGCFVVSS
jgi:hypothetical protein